MPLLMRRLISYDRLQTPPEHLDVLHEPAPRRLLDALREHLSSAPQRGAVPDSTLGALRSSLRARLHLSGPIVVSGHQVEFFHAGVLAKDIAAHELAQQTSGSAVFLLVDSDLPKTRQLIVPRAAGGAAQCVPIDIPGCDLKQPAEDQPTLLREDWLDFFARIANVYPFYGRSMLREYSSAWLATTGPVVDFCTAFIRAQTATEETLGLRDIRTLRISALAQTPEFHALLAHLMLNARSAAQAYNAAQSSYRQRHCVRVAARPVPPLAIDHERVELPVWITPPGRVRQRLFVRPAASWLELWAGDEFAITLPRDEIARAAYHAQPGPLEQTGWKLRPRALLLSAFARLLLADVFVHGIGGARYDEVMEDFAREVWGVAPAPAACISATLHLPLPLNRVTHRDVNAARRELRDLHCNPQRQLDTPPAELVAQRAALVRESESLKRDRPQDHQVRRAVFAQIRQINERMLATEEASVMRCEQRVATLTEQLAQDELARDRTYFFALHPYDTLRELTDRVRAACHCS